MNSACRPEYGVRHWDLVHGASPVFGVFLGPPSPRPSPREREMKRLRWVARHDLYSFVVSPNAFWKFDPPSPRQRRPAGRRCRGKPREGRRILAQGVSPGTARHQRFSKCRRGERAGVPVELDSLSPLRCCLRVNAAKIPKGIMISRYFV